MMIYGIGLANIYIYLLRETCHQILQGVYDTHVLSLF